MKHALPAWTSFALLGSLVAGCAAQATVTPPAVNANVDVNAAAAGTVDANGNVVAGVAPTDDYQDTDPSALTDFHQALDSHGTWVDDPTYGTVWVPAAAEVGPTYTPYSTAGHWAYDANDDYVWVSDYDWGWAPYHYGRWVEIEGRGWSWIPGRVYRGAWVTWGADGGYGTVGWAPMPPEFVWRGGVAVSYTYSGPARWSYVGRGDVFATNVGARVYTGSAAASAAGNVHPTGGGGVSGRSGGPSPQNLGMSAGQVPHVSGATAAGITKAQNFGHASTAASLGGHAPTKIASGTTATGGLKGEGTTSSGTGRSLTPTSTTMPSGLRGATTTTAATTTRPANEVPKASSQMGNHALPTTQTATTQPATGTLQVQPKRKKLPGETTTPTPKAGSGGHSGGGGGTGGGHSGPPHKD
ncbi:MAG TPA: DUF6600 domain-containing protein [Polyangiaceae bacterium]|jgi:hypothetical protein